MNQLNTYNTSIGYFVQTRLFIETFSETTTTHPGIFHGRALFKQESVSLEELSADSCPAEI